MDAQLRRLMAMQFVGKAWDEVHSSKEYLALVITSIPN